MNFGRNSDAFFHSQRFVMNCLGGREAAQPPVDDPIAYIFKDDHFAKVYGSRQGIYPFSYYTFSGLRYAEPPVGKYRFQRSKKVKLEGDVTGTKYGPPCIQPNPDHPSSIVGSEDCLFLNVHTPRVGVLVIVLFSPIHVPALIE